MEREQERDGKRMKQLSWKMELPFESAAQKDGTQSKSEKIEIGGRERCQRPRVYIVVYLQS